IHTLTDLADAVEQAVHRLSEVAIHLGNTVLSPEVKVAFAYAHPFLEVVGDVIMAWMHLWRASVAAPKLEKLAGGNDAAKVQAKIAKHKEAAYYDGQIKTAEFYILTLLPAAMGKMNAIETANPAAVNIHENSFGG
ncbi:MAG: acyl-CoA dehydrogenase C-terminal domain-containing protein, partial [Desulfobacterales bacterium]